VFARPAFFCVALAALTTIARRAPPPDCPRGVLPAYAHNDYGNSRPLHDALALGYRGVEADIFLVGGELRLGHERRVAEHGATLEAQYLSPLRALVARCGKLTESGLPLLLNVELKEKSRPTFDTLVALLGRYSDLLTPRTGQAPAVEVVLVGWWPPGFAGESQFPLRRQELLTHASGRPLEALDPTVRLLSLDYGKTMGRWWVMRGRRERWLSTLRANRTAFPGVLIRVYDVPVNEQLYRELLEAGVDLIGTTQLDATARVLSAH